MHPTTNIPKPEFKPWITQHHVRRVLLKFKAKKSPGPDKLKPIIFKYLRNTLDIIIFIYKACLKSHYTPRAWKESNVVLIYQNTGKTPTKKPNLFDPSHSVITSLKG